MRYILVLSVLIRYSIIRVTLKPALYIITFLSIYLLLEKKAYQYGLSVVIVSMVSCPYQHGSGSLSDKC